MLAGFADRHIVGFEDLSIDVFLEVQNKKYSQILHHITAAWAVDREFFIYFGVLGLLLAPFGVPLGSLWIPLGGLGLL